MTRREFLRRTAPMIVAGTLPLAGAHALWRKFFPESKGWDGRLSQKLVPVFIWGRQGLERHEFPDADEMQRRIAAAFQVPREYLFGNVDGQTVTAMARRMGIPLAPVRIPLVDRAFEDQKRLEGEVFRREYQRRFDDQA